MFRRNEAITGRRRAGRVRAAIGCILLALVVAAPVRSDDVASFLAQHGLKRLLATHLEQQLETAKPEERSELVLQLASLYAELLESVSNPVERKEIEERSRRLLEKAPANSADELRLALLRASYRIAEKNAENHRLRLATAAELESAKKTLTEIIPQLNTLRQRLKQNMEVADRRLSRASGSQAALLNETSDRTRMLYAQCTFLNAWALYYQSWLNNRDDNARPAEALFGELLAPDSASPQPSDVSVDLRSTEAIARCILGMALCKSLTSSTATAINWIKLLENENTFEPLRNEAPAWKIAIYLENGEYQHVQEILNDVPDKQKIPVAWLRLIAVHALEASQRNRVADALAKNAVLQLAAQGELSQVLDLANRYGPDALGNSGFALQYVRGVIDYQQARAAHHSEEPTLDPAIVSQYAQAASQLNAALNESDVSSYAAPAAACRSLIAWCWYFQSEFLKARDAFVLAAQALHGDDAAESLWMAIVSMDKLVQADKNPDLQTQLDDLTSQFLTRFPSNQHAAVLRLRKAVATTEVSPNAVDELLAIPPNSAVYDAAQRRASDMLYQLFRNSGGNDRIFLANRFLSVVLPLISDSALSAEINDAAATDRFIVRCRQTLEVALADGIDRVDAARAAFAALDELQKTNGIDLSSVQDEIDFRRVQDRLLARDTAAATTLADKLWNHDSSSLWARLAVRAIFQHAYHLWKSPDSTVEQQRRGIEMVVRYGGRVLYEFKDATDAPNKPGALGYFVAVAEASDALWQHTGDAERGKAALYLYEQLLNVRPNNAQFLRAAAKLSEALGDHQKSLERWRRLVAGDDPGSSEWFEAKFHLIKLLAELDPPRAREVMDQHKQLNPNFGPDPWGGMLKGLDAQIPQSPQPSESQPTSSGAESS